MSHREVMQQALEALNLSAVTVDSFGVQQATQDAITALRTALEQQQAEPVAWAVQGCSKMWRGEFAEIDSKAEAKRIGGTCVAYALYTTSPQRQWVGLTHEQTKDCLKAWDENDAYALCRAIEAKLKEKNT